MPGDATKWALSARRVGIAVAAALAAGVVAAVANGKGPGIVLASYWLGAFGRWTSLADTVARTAPLIFSGLALAVGLHCGLFNVGAEGQMLLGGAAGAACGLFLPEMPGVLHLPLVLLCGAGAGATSGMIPGILKACRGVHEVVATILLNYVAIHFCRFLLSGPMRGRVNPVGSDPLPSVAHMGVLWRAGAIEVTWAIVLAVATCACVWWWLRSTPSGWRMKATGLGERAARLSGLPVKRTIITAMTVSGALAGLGGAVHVASIPTHTSPRAMASRALRWLCLPPVTRSGLHWPRSGSPASRARRT